MLETLYVMTPWHIDTTRWRSISARKGPFHY